MFSTTPTHLIFSNVKTLLEGIHHCGSAKYVYVYLNESRYNSIGGSTCSTRSALYSESWEMPLPQPMLSFTQVIGNTLDVAGVGLNRTGTVRTSFGHQLAEPSANPNFREGSWAKTRVCAVLRGFAANV